MRAHVHNNNNNNKKERIHTHTLARKTHLSGWKMLHRFKGLTQLLNGITNFLFVLFQRGTRAAAATACRSRLSRALRELSATAADGDDCDGGCGSDCDGDDGGGGGCGNKQHLKCERQQNNSACRTHTRTELKVI